MPTVLDYFREKDPRFKDVSDAQLSAYIKDRFPDLAGQLPSGKLTQFQQKAKSRKLGIDVEQNAATMAEEIGTAKGKAASDIMKGVVLGGAALATGGLGVAPAAALMGAAGVGAETLGQTAKARFGSTDVPKSGKALARDLGLEGLLSAGGEGGARAVGYGLKKLGTSLLPAIVMRSAAKAEAGQQALTRAQQDSFSQLRTFVRDKGNPVVDIGDDIVGFFGAIRERATGTSRVFKAHMKPIFATLWKASGNEGTMGYQPLDALMEIKTDLNHVAFKVKGMNSDEVVALQNLAKKVDARIVNSLKELGGTAATKVYQNYKAFTEQIKTDSAALGIAEDGLKKFLGRAVRYVPGIDAGIDSIIRSKVAPWALEHMYSNPKTAGLVKDAFAMVSRGDTRGAQRAFDAAINTSGVGTLLKDVLKKDSSSPFRILEPQGESDQLMPAQTAGP